MFRFVSVILAKGRPASPAVHRKVVKRIVRRAVSPAAKRVPSLSTTPSASGADSGAVEVVGSTHVDPQTNLPRMVDISAKRPSYRLATAVSTVVVPSTANVMLEGMKQTLNPPPRHLAEHVSDMGAPTAPIEEYYTSKKGPLFATAVIAGTNAVKQASTLIPFCHQLPIQKCSFTFRRRVVKSAVRPSSLPHRVVLRKRTSAEAPPSGGRSEYSVLYCFCTVATDEYKTGVEMEALTGATVAAITLYDMLKGLPGAQEDGLGLGESFILAKRGGKNDFTKLLMSEPVTPVPAPPQLSAVDEPMKELPPSSASMASAAARALGATADKDDGDDVAEEDEEADEETEPAVKSPYRSHVDVSSSIGDTGAWWRSTKHEKRMHEQHPRRKYGSGSRVAFPDPKTRVAPMKDSKPSTYEEDMEDDEEIEEPIAPGQPLGRKVGKSARKSVRVEVDEEEEEGGADEDDAPATRAKMSKRHHVKTGLAHRSSAGSINGTEDDDDENEEWSHTTTKEVKQPRKSGKDAKPPARLANKAVEVEEDEEEGEADEEEEAVVEVKHRRRFPAVIRAEAARRAARAPPAVDVDDEDVDDADESDEDKPSRTRVKPSKLVKKAEQKASVRGRPRAQPVEKFDDDEIEDPPPRHHRSSKTKYVEEEEDDEEDEPVIRPTRVGTKSSGRDTMRTVQHDSWDNETMIYDMDEEPEDDEDEPPVPSRRKGKKKRAGRR